VTSRRSCRADALAAAEFHASCVLKDSRLVSVKVIAKLVAINFETADQSAAHGELVFQQACRMGLEGIVSKRLSKPYQSGLLVVIGRQLSVHRAAVLGCSKSGRRGCWPVVYLPARER
jgi:hypothetical protein